MDASPKKHSKDNPKGYVYFTSGVFFAQLAGNALHVLLPIWVLTLVQKSPATLAVLLFFFALLDTAGTMVGGWLLKSLSCSRMVFAASVFRFCAALTFALIYSLNMMNGIAFGSLWIWLCVLFAVDSLARGVADTGRYTMPLELVKSSDRQKLHLQKANGLLQSFFELGAVIGPVLVGLLFSFGQAEITAWLLVALYGASCLFYWSMGRYTKKDPARTELPLQSSPESMASSEQDQSASIKVLLLLQGLLTIYPMRALLPAIFAVQVFGHAPLTAWFVAAFGLGGVLGSKFYAWIGRGIELRYQMRIAGTAVGLLTCLLLSKSVALHMFGYFIFMFFNTSCRLAVLSEVQLLSTMAISQLRFVANSTSMFLKIGLGALLVVPGGIFWSTGLIAACGGLQILGSYFTDESSLKNTAKEGLLWEN